MKKIKLTQNKYVFVDNEDYNELIKYKWNARKSNKGSDIWYAWRGIHHRKIMPQQELISMHSQVLNFPKNYIDHINGNGLDNRKQNLRSCTFSQNIWNQKIRKNNTSGFKGVSWDKYNKKWRSRIGFNYKYILIGYFDDPINAANAYNKKAKELFGKFARLNVINK